MKILESLHKIIGYEIDPAFALRAQFIIDAIFKHKPKRVLDIGCGRGFYVKLISFFPFIKEIVGVDMNKEYLKKAQTGVKQDSRVRLQIGSIYKLPFKDNYFDCIVASEILEHLADDKKAVIELYRVLKKDGVLLVTVPNKNYPFLWDPLNWILERVFKTHINKNIWWLAGIWADHERLYSEKDIQSVLESKFKILYSKLVIHWCWPFTHFFLYGIGKNLVERVGTKEFDRFNFEKNRPLARTLAWLIRLPSILLDKRIKISPSQNIVLEVSK